MEPEKYAPVDSSAPVSLYARLRSAWILSFLFVVLVVVGYSVAFVPPANFPTGSIVVIARGASAPDIATQLAISHIIKHPHVLQAILRISGTSSRLQSGAYLFDTPENSFTIAYRLVTGDFGLPSIRITFPEGETARDAATRVSDAFDNISVSDFISKAQPYEGYLFPDTYTFQSSADADVIVKAMRDNFNVKISPFLKEVEVSSHPLTDIVIMASLVEKEARTSPVRRMVAGILTNRLALGMPLQVDAVFGYIFNKDTYSPTYADLKVDSPYNTYTHTGLPPGPIDNPSIDSIDAALHPTETEYLYYLTGKDGRMYYATTYAGHQENRRKYLH